MRRYWISPENISDNQVNINGDLYHHLLDVCRVKEGELFELLCGDGWAYLARLEKVGKKTASGSILERRHVEPLAKPYIHLCVSVPRFQKMDLILEKAVELGVYKV